MEAPQSWEEVRGKLNKLKPLVDKTVADCEKDMARYPKMNNNGEHLSQILANLNWYVMKLGNIHSETEALKVWTEKRFEIEKGIELDRLVKVEKVGVTQAAGTKYVHVQQFLDPVVRASAMHLKVQNARSTARDATEGIRSRIGQLRGQMRSS